MPLAVTPGKKDHGEDIDCREDPWLTARNHDRRLCVPASHAKRVAAARVYVAASVKSGQPVPDWIRELAADKAR
ncbi:hypothetical protein DFJ65_0915 [Calidifontibacter indicus]|uniref:Uncharacterized protein n=1 Tax=Calidifontibacter indicus TaxID=419650 RepID=A0A3D9UKS8_9MICO|nr:hypothetical protein DFJ65_0915 [Calidifontibacter indicus]